MERSIQCPSCGSPVPLRHRNVLLVTCAACDTVSAIEKDGVDPLGKTATLTDFMSALTVGTIASIQGRRFQALGRVRFEYEDGYWDEWYLAFDDGTDGWLEEDEGELALVSQVPVTSTPPHPRTVRAGERVTWGQDSIYVLETGTATLVGMEGQLPRGHFIGMTMDYLDGTMDGRVVMLEFMPDEVECFVGTKIDFDDLEVENT